jgi:adenosine/AMP kinase
LSIDYKILIESLDIPNEYNIILGQSHFIKTVEDLYEAIVSSMPKISFGIAFNEASGPCLVRKDGNDAELVELAAERLFKIGAGHSFLIILKDAFPINVLHAVKSCPEVVNIFCATANPVQVVIAESSQGRGIIGVIDGSKPTDIETEDDIEKRKSFLRNIGYKR